METLKVDDWQEIIDNGGKEHILTCPNTGCCRQSTLLFDNFGSYINQKPRLIGQSGGFVILNHFGRQTTMFAPKIQTSIAYIWGCEQCKHLTYTNCMVEETIAGGYNKKLLTIT